MKHLFKSASIALALSAGAAFAEAEHTLVISSWAPPTHGINAQMWPTFVDMIEDATDGKVTAELKLGIAPPPAQMDIVQDGAADVSIIFHGYQPGRFVTTKLIELPGYEGTAEEASVAYWRVYESHLKAADEHRGVKVIAMHTHGPAQLHTSNEITSLADVSGLKVRIPGGVGGDVGTALGATGIQVPAPKVYETLASNAADGVVMPLESRKGFKLTEVAQNVYELPGGLYRGSFAFIMNEDAFADLPEVYQAALEEKVFGEPLSRALGAIWDDIDAAGREATESAEGNAIVPASADDVAAFQKLSEGIIANVLQEVDGEGVDANAAYAQVKTELAGQ
ncbi:ABC transporter substrate-binding protein [Roseobacter cerasinus]|uniref:ABC transporter substrate-binding protein n=1 Tax=Roseobacter cerasinus TaxID=2602289 RepID=A0A640VXM5_9RHOB|nr:TRAP transporter substrate-binding protein [Roseobacter cerasinus]GFE52110.1 ABC transporter substrate-binding protein [Roseobacter cerasinus]